MRVGVAYGSVGEVLVNGAEAGKFSFSLLAAEPDSKD